jgi:hypothetical protein
MSISKSTHARQAVGAMIIGATTGNPARGVAGAGAISPLQFPGNLSPSTIYLFRHSFVDMSAAGLWAASVATAHSASQPIPFVGCNVGDIVSIQPNIPPLTGVSYSGLIQDAFSLTNWSASQTGLVIGQVQSAQSMPTYTRTTPVLTNGLAYVADAGANDNDIGAHLTGTNISANTVIVRVKTGTGFIMSKPATGVTSGTYSFAPFSAYAVQSGSTTGAGTPVWANAALPGQTIVDGGATPVTWVNLGTGCPVLNWVNATGGTIAAGAGLLGTYQVNLFGARG